MSFWGLFSVSGLVNLLFECASYHIDLLECCTEMCQDVLHYFEGGNSCIKTYIRTEFSQKHARTKYKRLIKSVKEKHL